jgi:hypothetical protein
LNEKEVQRFIAEDFIWCEGAVIYNVHWESSRTADGAVSYPADRRWGQSISVYPNFMMKKFRASGTKAETEIYTEDPLWQSDFDSAVKKYRVPDYSMDRPSE